VCHQKEYPEEGVCTRGTIRGIKSTGSRRDSAGKADRPAGNRPSVDINDQGSEGEDWTYETSEGGLVSGSERGLVSRPGQAPVKELIGPDKTITNAGEKNMDVATSRGSKMGQGSSRRKMTLIRSHSDQERRGGGN